jgi:hypothetical protein
MKLADAFVEIKGDKGKFSATIRGAKRETASFATSATKNLKKISIGLAAVGTAAAAAAVAIGVKLTRAIINAGKASVLTAVKYDKLKRGLTAVAGGAEEAERQFIRLRKVAELPGLSFEAALQGSINLQAAGIEAALAERALSAFGNALVTVGKGAEDLSGVNLALTQIANKTSGFGQDVRQLQERLPQMQTALKNAFDGKPLEDVSITGKQLVAALVTEFEKLPKAAGGIANSIENLKIGFDLLKDAVGRTMLEATGKLADGISGIIQKLTVVIDNFTLLRDHVALVFSEIAVIGFTTWAKMLQSMVTLTIAATKFMAIPLKATWKSLGLALEDTLGKAIIRQFTFTKEASDRLLAQREQRTTEHMKIIMDEFTKDITPGFDELVNVMNTELRESMAEALKGLSGINLQLKALTDRAEEFAKFKAAMRAWADDIINGLLPAARDMQKAFGNLNLDFLIFQWKDLRIQMAGAADLGERLAKGFGGEGFGISPAFQESMKDYFESIRNEAQDTADTIRPAFENMFSNLFGGETKSLWEAFWVDLKRIAIRQMATIFATQLLTGLVTGGASFGGVGLGSALAALAPKSVDPTTRAIGSGISSGVKAVGGFLEGGTVIINDQDLTNFDQQRLTKQVEQGIGPALAEAAADGIQ